MRLGIRYPTTFAIMALLMALQACSTTGGSSSAPTPVTAPSATQPSTQPSVAQAKARAERLAQELAQAEARSHHQRYNRGPAANIPPASTQPARPGTTRTTAAPATQPHQAAPPRLTRAQLLNQLIDRIVADDDPAQQKAVRALGLSLLEPNLQINQRLMAGLTQTQQHQVAQVHQLLVVLAQRIAQGQPVTPDGIDQQLNRIFSDQPIEIHRMVLCKQVVGFGVYQPFKHYRFLAGTDHKVIIYVELRHFRCVKNDAGQYQVKLKQKVMLFNQSDGLVVWQHKPVEIVDTSRDRRHDFFVVQLIDLPANLTVGKYRLKVRVTDQQGGSLAEKTLGLQIVADKALLGK